MHLGTQSTLRRAGAFLLVLCTAACAKVSAPSDLGTADQAIHSDSVGEQLGPNQLPVPLFELEPAAATEAWGEGAGGAGGAGAGGAGGSGGEGEVQAPAPTSTINAPQFGSTAGADGGAGDTPDQPGQGLAATGGEGGAPASSTINAPQFGSTVGAGGGGGAGAGDAVDGGSTGGAGGGDAAEQPGQGVYVPSFGH